MVISYVHQTRFREISTRIPPVLLFLESESFLTHSLIDTSLDQTQNSFLTMPMTAAERMRRYRDKLVQSGKQTDYHAKDARRKQHERAGKSVAAKEKQRLLNQEYAKYRDKLKREKSQSTPPNSSPAFKSRSSLGKAARRVKRCLPYSPRKKKKVVSTLCK